jgi:hypothetical protein
MPRLLIICHEYFTPERTCHTFAAAEITAMLPFSRAPLSHAHYALLPMSHFFFTGAPRLSLILSSPTGVAFPAIIAFEHVELPRYC